jgi:hypothetical protein
MPAEALPARLARLVVALSTLCGPQARAQTESPAPAPEPQSTPAATPVSRSADASPWRLRYDVARTLLLEGDFVGAAASLDALARDAQDPMDRALAEGMRDLAQAWARRGLTLAPPGVKSEAPTTAPAGNERTIDELAQLYASSILYGVGTGIWVDVHTQPQTAGGAVLPMVLASGAAAGTVALLDVGHPLHYGVPQAIVSGMYMGFEQGVALTLWNTSLSDYSSQWSGPTQADLIWALSTVGAVGGGVLGASLGTTPGRASFVGSASLWTGVVTGFLVGTATGGQAHAASGSLLAAEVGLNAGMIAGLLAAGPVSPSIARVRFLDVGAIGGGLLAEGLYLAAAGRNPDVQPASFFAGLGVMTGLGIAWAATSRMPRDRPGAFHDETRPPAALAPTLAPIAGGATLGVAGTM